MNSSITCIIIDDEDYAIESLSDILKLLYNKINIIGTYTSWKDGLEALRTLKADILFLDISIAGKNGMDLLKLVPDIDSEVIFVTAFSEHALEAFNFLATGYIVKPIGEIELSKAVDKAIERISHKNHYITNQKPEQTLASKIGIPCSSGIDYLNINEILYFEGAAAYTNVVTLHTQILSSFPLGKYKEILERNTFYQVHRSYIVNLNHIRRYNSSGDIVMINDMKIPVSKNLREEFLHLFNMVSRGGE